jgi:hypothetical protein
MSLAAWQPARLGDAAAAWWSAVGTIFFLFGDWMALIYKPLWVADAVLFVTSTILNVRLHGAK